MTEQEMDELKKTFKKLEANQETTSTGDEAAQQHLVCAVCGSKDLLQVCFVNMGPFWTLR